MKNLDAISAPEDVPTKKYVDDAVTAGGGGGLSQAAADARYVNIDGDTMTGSLTVTGGSFRADYSSAAGIADVEVWEADGWLYGRLESANADVTGFASLMTRANDSTGAISIGSSHETFISSDTQLSLRSKQPIDLGDSMSNPQKITNLKAPTGDLDAANKAYVDSRAPKITVGTTAPSSPAVNDVWIDTNP